MIWEVQIPKDRIGIRIQEGIIGLFPESLPSRKACRKALDTGRVTVVRKGQALRATTALVLQPGDQILLRPTEFASPTSSLTVHIGWEDAVHAVVWKPAGWVTSGAGRPSLRDTLPAQLTAPRDADALARPEPVHRLDRETGGWILVAKTARAAQVLASQVEPGGAAQKRYQAVCWGTVPVAFTVGIPLDGRSALTRCTRLASGPLGSGTASWIQVDLHSGRTHQIRRHLAGLGHPLVGDARYGGGTGTSMLVCTDLTYLDPITGNHRALSAPLPKRFRRLPWLRHAFSDRT